jgi:hypothetical protein
VTLFVRRVLDQGGKGSPHDFSSELSELNRRFGQRNDNDTHKLLIQLARNLDQTLPTIPIESKEIDHLTNDRWEAVVEKVPYTSHRRIESYVTEKILPSFAADESEFFINSMIERSASSSDLYLTRLLLR